MTHLLEMKSRRAPVAGAQEAQKVEPFGLRAAWLHWADERELRRLAKLHMRIERKKAALHELTQERHTIMRRCIRRMRRERGLQ